MSSPERQPGLNRRLCVAPMMDWTDRHCRYFHRLLAPHSLLYTEMVTTGALLHGNRERHLAFHPAEHPVALQLGGCEPDELAACARIGEDFGYDEINLNVGCPSDRVQTGRFGACLMREPERVRDCVGAMIEAVDIPVTVKHRIGVDNQDEEADLERFVETVEGSGCRTFIVHARKAWLQGLSPKQNRDVPPLNYARIYRLQADHPQLEIILNGGIERSEQVRTHLQQVPGVMLGRAAYQNPYWLARLDAELFGGEALPRQDYVAALRDYIEAHRTGGGRLQHIARHLLGLYQAVPGARGWRQTISQRAHLDGAGFEVLEAALAAVIERAPKPVENA